MYKKICDWCKGDAQNLKYGFPEENSAEHFIVIEIKAWTFGHTSASFHLCETCLMEFMGVEK